MQWKEISDEYFDINHTQTGMVVNSPLYLFVFDKTCYLDQSLPEYLPHRSCLRELFTRYLDFNAVPRRSFFQYLRYFTQDPMEVERLDEFLAESGAVSHPSLPYECIGEADV